MSWLSKVGIFLTSWLFAVPAIGARIDFHKSNDRVQYEAHVLNRGDQGEGPLPVRVHLSLPAIEVDRNADGFSEVKVDHLLPLGELGKPALYGTGSLIAIPEGYEADLKILKEESQEVPGCVVNPNQKKFRCSVENRGFEFNASLYHSTALYPSTVASLEPVGKPQGVRLVRIAIHPMQMDFATQSLRITHELDVEVSFRRVSRGSAVRLSSEFYNLVRNWTVNGKQLGVGALLRDSQQLMLILVADSLKATVQPLVTWKQAKGIKVQVVTTTEAGSTKEKIKSYIQNVYNTGALKPTYLVFVGNRTSMPTFMESTSSGSAASDRPYALLTGTEVPDALYGRVVADNATEANAQISRWIEYEKTPDKGAAWYASATTIGSSASGAGPSDKEYCQQVGTALSTHTYKKVDGFYEGEHTATYANISTAINEGRTWIAYFGHGSGTSWGSTNDEFSNTQVDKLQNGGKLPILIDVACENASWVNLSRPFGKAWVTRTFNGKNAGAVGYYGGSVSISWDEPAVMSVGIAKSHFEKPVTTLGGSVLAGQLYLQAQMGTGENTIENLKWYNLFGDPSMLIRTATPIAYQVKLQVRPIVGTVAITVTVKDPAGNPMKDVNAALSVKGESITSAQTNASGQALLTVPGASALEPDTLLTTTGYNLETVETQVN